MNNRIDRDLFRNPQISQEELLRRLSSLVEILHAMMQEIIEKLEALSE